MPGARCTRGPVCKKSGGRTRAYRFSGDTPTFPAQWFYGLLRALPGDQACLTPSPSDMARARPVGPTRLRRLDADHEASEPRDFTVRTAPFVSLPPIAHGVDPALPSRVTPDAAASTASRPNVSDDPDTPLAGQDGGRYAGDLGEESRTISENQNSSADAPRSGSIQSDVPEDDGLHALLAISGAGLVRLGRCPRCPDSHRILRCRRISRCAIERTRSRGKVRRRGRGTASSAVTI